MLFPVCVIHPSLWSQNLTRSSCCKFVGNTSNTFQEIVLTSPKSAVFSVFYSTMTLTFDLTRCCTQPAVGRSTLHVDQSLARAHASAAVSPVSRMIWPIHVVRGLPAGRFQSWCGVSPDLESMASFGALCAGVLSGKRRMWPKMEWRRAAMVLSMLGRFMLSATALLVMKSFHLMPRIRLACHVECLQPAWVFLQQCPGFSTMKAYCQNTCRS